MSDTIRILIADDHAVVRRGLRALIDTESGMEVVGEAEDGVEATEKARSLRPDVVLLDMMMPRKDGLDALREIKRDDPETRILILTSFAEDDKVFPAIKSGALGYLLKDSSPEDLLRAIKDVYEGASSLHPTIARMLIGEISRTTDLPLIEDPLTEREVEVLKLVARGLTNDEIAGMLVVSSRTVGKHVSNILDKLHLANRTQAALYALQEGMASLDSA